MPNTGNRASTILRARARNAQPEESVETFVHEDDTDKQGVQVSRSGYGKMIVYKLTPFGCRRTAINVQSIDEVLKRPNYAGECFDCGQDDCLYDTEVRGEKSTNKCPGKPSRKMRICPEISCRKPIYDTRPTGMKLTDEFDNSSREFDEVDVIGNDDLATQSPEEFTKSKLEIHVLAYHPELARTMGMRRGEELPAPMAVG